MLLAMFVAGILVNLSQTGIVFSTQKLVPKLSHISPLSGAKRILSLQGLARIGFGLFKVAVIAVVALLSLQHDRRLDSRSRLDVGTADRQGFVRLFDADLCLDRWRPVCSRDPGVPVSALEARAGSDDDRPGDPG